MKELKQFIGIYPVSKTLRFELRPVGKTLEWIERNGILEKDERRANDYPKVKNLIDDFHKVCIHDSLKNVRFDWQPLKKAIEENRKNNSEDAKKKLEKEQTIMRKQIKAAIEKFRYYNELTAPTPQNLLSDVFHEVYGDDDESIKSFDRFSVYFRGFQENRKNIYSSEAISTGVPYRLVHDNFPKFLADIEVYDNIKTICPEIIEQIAAELKPFLGGRKIDSFFRIDSYNDLLTQDSIEFFNQVIGGVSEEGKPKFRGINELTNLYRQQHPELGSKKKALTMIPLFKQILSDRDTLSDIPQQIESEKQLIETITSFHTHLTQYERNGEKVNILEELTSLIGKVGDYNPDGIYISSKFLTGISQKIFGHWSIINERLEKHAIEKFGNIKGANNKKKIDNYLSKKAFCLSELPFDEEHDVASLFSELPHTLDSIQKSWIRFQEWCNGESRQLFQNNPEGTEIVKNLLDFMMEFMHKCSVLLAPEEYDVDKDFYNEFMPLYAEYSNMVFLYNKVRNFLTKKLIDVKKYKLNFGVPSLCDGWDLNKESTNKAILLFKGGLSYLGIMNARNILANVDKDNLNCKTYSKMIYKFLPGPNKMLPKVFFSKKGREMFTPSKMIVDIYESGAFKKNSPDFSKKKLHALIDFYKEAINKHEDWSKFGFIFSPTESYEDISSFFNEIAKQSYVIRFTNIPDQQVNEWVENGQLYLFQLYNKDYAEGSHGRKNLHTLYWENLFSLENLNNLVLKLNGQAELFYRPQSIKKTVTHKVGSKMLNRRDKSGMPIPEAIYHSLYQYFNGKKQELELTDIEKAYIDKVIVKNVTHEITKDRRYTKPEFFFHVPITFNTNADGNDYINEKVQEYIKDNPDVNIIGIDRGERHLIYLTLINQRGEILKQKTFNTVGNYNYQAKLVQREQERDEARKSWQSIGKIKDLKEGFLSAVIHEIAKMMIEHNAIVVLEDLNFGFKRGRFKVERQVYQKFEKMLIDKLNYLSFKDCKADEDGGILRGYQLAQQFVSFQRLGKQSGFLFYIPAAYTSKIDPITGFVNHFNFNDITNTENRRDFFMKMERIEMKDGDIEFEFDYRKFKTYQTDFKNVWTVSTYGKKIVMQPNELGHKRMVDFYPTQQIIQVFESKGITLKDGTDIKALLATIEANITNASFYSTLFYSFQKTLQMRNSNSETEEDYILSPVAVDGKHFCSIDEANKGCDADGNWISKLPVDADANGAYHIALKGLYLLRSPELKKIETEKWLQFMVEKPYLAK